MEKKYREVFDGVRASERLRKEVLEMKYLERKETRYALRPALAAVLAVLLLAACAAVPGAASALADYFSERWSEQNETALTQEQLDFIGAITQTVGVSDTVDGVTVTLEAVTAGESSLWMLLTMDGLDVPAEELVGEDLRYLRPIVQDQAGLASGEREAVIHQIDVHLRSPAGGRPDHPPQIAPSALDASGALSFYGQNFKFCLSPFLFWARWVIMAEKV